MPIRIDPEKCVRCQACVRDCIVEILKPGPDNVPFLAPELEKFCLNCQHCLAVCPEGAVVCHGTGPEKYASVGPLPDEEDLLHLIRQRRSIRQYERDALPEETLEKLKASLAWAPTGCNDHRLWFRIVEDPAEMTAFRQELFKAIRFLIRTGIMRLVYPNYKRFLGEILNGKDVIFRDAPHMIVCATPKNAPCRGADPWIALTQFDLYAQTLGVGTCWCGFALYAFRFLPGMKKLLHLPKGYRAGSVLLFGKPAVSYPRATCPKNYRIRSGTHRI